jgi:signal peptidase I
MGSFFKALLWVLLFLGGAAGVVYMFFCDVWVVPSDDPAMGASIAPTLEAGDVVIIDRHAGAGRGHLLRCINPQQPDRFVIGRAIGMPGDVVDMNGEVVAIDGHRTPSPRACSPAIVMVHDPVTDEDVPLANAVEDYGDAEFCALRSQTSPYPPMRVSVENGKVYLLSDDRHLHFDSRDFESVAPGTCQHILYRLVSARGWTDDAKRLTVIW